LHFDEADRDLYRTTLIGETVGVELRVDRAHKQVIIAGVKPDGANPSLRRTQLLRSPSSAMQRHHVLAGIAGKAGIRAGDLVVEVAGLQLEWSPIATDVGLVLEALADATDGLIAVQVRKTQHGPTCIFLANLTPFSLQWSLRRSGRRASGSLHDFPAVPKHDTSEMQLPHGLMGLPTVTLPEIAM
jgi:hypothetical protein